MLPMIEINTIGAGAGSIAWLDVRNGLHVGPQSAGAEPGPAAYGRGGTEPTVADANIVLGRLHPDRFLGGRMKLDLEAARRAIMDNVGSPLGLSLEEAAAGIIRIANANMERAVRVSSAEKGFDPRDITLVAFGGAGAAARGGARRRRRHSGGAGAAAPGGVLRRRTGDGRHPPRLRSDPGHARRGHHRRPACPALCRARSAGPRRAGAGRGRRGTLRAAALRRPALRRAGLRGERAGLRRAARSGLDERGDRTFPRASTSGSMPTLIPTGRSSS